MSTTHVRIDPDDPATFPAGRINAAKIDSTTEEKIGLQQREDDAEAMQDAARYARRVLDARTRPTGWQEEDP